MMTLAEIRRRRSEFLSRPKGFAPIVTFEFDDIPGQEKAATSEVQRCGTISEGVGYWYGAVDMDAAKDHAKVTNERHGGAYIDAEREMEHRLRYERAQKALERQSINRAAARRKRDQQEMARQHLRAASVHAARLVDRLADMVWEDRRYQRRMADVAVHIAHVVSYGPTDRLLQLSTNAAALEIFRREPAQHRRMCERAAREPWERAIVDRAVDHVAWLRKHYAGKRFVFNNEERVAVTFGLHSKMNSNLIGVWSEDQYGEASVIPLHRAEWI